MSALDAEAFRALYLHIPFCRQRCRYCDFTTEAAPSDSPAMRAYLDTLIADIRAASKAGDLAAVETVYIGGGTPSYLGQARLAELLYLLSLSMRLETQVECTMEANPDSLTERMVRDIFALGVNRLSIGVQSFDDEVLRVLGRVHDAAAAREAIAIAQTRFENVSVDFMCGIPGQSLEGFEAGVREAISLGVTHVSVYPLAIEEGTPFAQMVASGELLEPDDDVQAACMEAAARILRQAGFTRYEVASYAKPGFECRHNIAYWTGVPYLGLGRGAVSMEQGPGWRRRVRNGAVEDELDAAQMAAEDLMLGMRMSAGVSEEQVASAADLLSKLPETLAALEARGLVVLREGRWRPTDLGWLCGNELYGELLFLAP